MDKNQPVTVYVKEVDQLSQENNYTVQTYNLVNWTITQHRVEGYAKEDLDCGRIRQVSFFADNVERVEQYARFQHNEECKQLKSPSLDSKLCNCTQLVNARLKSA